MKITYEKKIYFTYMYVGKQLDISYWSPTRKKILPQNFLAQRKNYCLQQKFNFGKKS